MHSAEKSKRKLHIYTHSIVFWQTGTFTVQFCKQLFTLMELSSPPSSLSSSFSFIRWYIHGSDLSSESCGKIVLLGNSSSSAQSIGPALSLDVPIVNGPVAPSSTPSSPGNEGAVCVVLNGPMRAHRVQCVLRWDSCTDR